jgi:S1-C subfamily serine protease
MRGAATQAMIAGRSASELHSISDRLADAVDRIGASVVQVQGRRRPVSGLVQGPGIVVTAAKALDGQDAATVRASDGRVLESETAGWDPATHLAILRVPGLESPSAVPADGPPRAGHLAVAVARSWSNALTASLGLVTVIGGPLRTGRGLAIPEVIRTSAPMHDGFAGAAFADPSGALIGICTGSQIRGFGVVIPAAIAWSAATDVLTHGQRRRGYLGIAGQPVQLSERQRGPQGPERGVLVVGITSGSPAEAAGVLVGDILVDFDSRAIESPDDLLEALATDCIDRQLAVRVIRGASREELLVTIGSVAM